MRNGAVDELKRLAGARVFLSMPWLAGVSPRVLAGRGAEDHLTDEPLPRRHGVFGLDEAALGVLDHGALYGDAAFEGVLISGSRLFLWREHLARLDASARSLRISIDYEAADLTEQVLRAVRGAELSAGALGYLRLVVTRGLGDLGINPETCVGSTVYAIAAQIRLYPEALYRKGIALALARAVRRPGPSVLDPNVKCCNYLNNVMALATAAGDQAPEALMLTAEGYIAEATADNFFLVERRGGWPVDPASVLVRTPSGRYCLEGITRGLVMSAAAELGYSVQEDPAMLPSDCFGDRREAFLTGTAAGVVPVTEIDGREVGGGKPGPVTAILRERLRAAVADPRRGLSVTASRQEIEAYLAGGRGFGLVPQVRQSQTGGFRVARNHRAAV